MNNFIEQDVSLEKCPALVLNADYRPLSYYPLSLMVMARHSKVCFFRSCNHCK